MPKPTTYLSFNDALSMKTNEFIYLLEAQQLTLLADSDRLLLKSKRGKLDPASIVNYAELVDYIKTRKADLLAHLTHSPMMAQASSLPTVTAVYPLSPLQEGLLAHALYEEQSSDYIEQFSCLLTGAIDVAVFRRAWSAIVAQHTSFRTSMHVQNLSTPLQCVHRQVTVPFQFLDYTALSAAEQAEQLATLIAADYRTGFDLQRPPLMRLMLIDLCHNRHRLVWTLHHLIIDGWSVPVVLQELSATYQMLLLGKPLPTLPEDQYETFISHLRTKPLAATEAFWRTYLADVETPTHLAGKPLATADSGECIDQIATEHLILTPKQTARLLTYAKQNHLTINTLLQGAWALLLAAYTGQSSVTFGVTVSGRPAELDNVEQKVGLFINTIPLTTTLNGDQPVAEWLTALQQGHSAAREHQHTALFQLKRLTGIRENLFDSILVMENFPLHGLLTQAKGLTISDAHLREQTNFPLTLVAEVADGLTVNLNYKTSLFHPSRIEQMVQQFRQLLDQFLAADATLTLRELNMLTPTDEQYLRQLGEPIPSPNRFVTLTELLAERVSRYASQPAIIWQGQAVTFAELNQQADRLAAYLMANGVGQGEVVGLCLHRSPLLMVGLLAVLKTGAAYTPIDPEYPDARIDYILNDAGVGVLLCESATHRTSVGQSAVCVLLDQPLSNEPTAAGPFPTVSPDDLAYILYTSGSTGQPKGVRISHGALANYVQSTSVYISDNQPNQSGTYFNMSVSFDMSITILFTPLLAGKPIVMAEGDTITLFEDPAFLAHAPYDFLTMTPTQFSLLDEFLERKGDPWVADRYVLGGEPLRQTHFQRIRDKGIDVEIVNLYGPTETTVACSTYHFRTQGVINQTPGSVVIGRPLPNVNLYVLDAHGRLALPGVAGELYVGGIQVGAGYQQKPDATRQRFVTHPLGRLYRTGDLVAWQPGSDLGFLGRNDDQVKLRGYRIELGEVETALRQAPGIKNAVVDVKRVQETVTGLIGYLETTAAYRKEIVIDFLRGRLPTYMIPATLLEVDSIPQTASGKANKQALALLPQAQPAYAPIDTVYLTPTEQRLLPIWQQLLHTDNIPIDADFFDLGGDSMAIIQLTNKLRISGLVVKPKVIFTHPTIRQLAHYLDNTAASDKQQPASTTNPHLVCLQQYGTETPLFIVPGGYGTADFYADLAQGMGQQQPVYGLQTLGTFPGETPQESVTAIAEQNIAWIREKQPQGPYRLIGHSFGTRVAYEMAVQLEAQQQQIGFLALIDSVARVEVSSRQEKVERLIGYISNYITRNDIKLPTNWQTALYEQLPMTTFHENWSAFATQLERYAIDPALVLPFEQMLKVAIAGLDMPYEPTRKLSQPITLLKADETDWTGHAPDLGWAACTDTLHIVSTPGDHLSLLIDERAAQTAAVLLNQMNAVLA